MDAFHSDGYDYNSQNLSETSVNRLFSYSHQDQLLEEVSEEYNDLLDANSVEEVVNLYKIASRSEKGFVRDSNGEAVHVDDLQELTEIVDRHLGGEQQ
ncbi:MAG: hypothetical protein ABEK16_04915 [Candidatus Nanohalobium sp.]